MKRADKVKKRKERAFKRRQVKMQKYVDKIQLALSGNYPSRITLSACRVGGCWKDPSSPTGYSQKCDWVGTCQYPCNGDC